MAEVSRFLRDEDGAVTIDWVSLTAGILLLGMAVVFTVFNVGVTGAVGGVNDTMDTVTFIELPAQPNFNNG